MDLTPLFEQAYEQSNAKWKQDPHTRKFYSYFWENEGIRYKKFFMEITDVNHSLFTNSWESWKQILQDQFHHVDDREKYIPRGFYLLAIYKDGSLHDCWFYAPLLNVTYQSSGGHSGARYYFVFNDKQNSWYIIDSEENYMFDENIEETLFCDLHPDEYTKEQIESIYSQQDFTYEDLFTKICVDNGKRANRVSINLNKIQIHDDHIQINETIKVS